MYRWLGEIGFGCEQLDDGSLYFHVYEHQDWATRALVADGPHLTDCGMAQT